MKAKAFLKNDRSKWLAINDHFLSLPLKFNIFLLESNFIRNDFFCEAKFDDLPLSLINAFSLISILPSFIIVTEHSDSSSLIDSDACIEINGKFVTWNSFVWFKDSEESIW